MTCIFVIILFLYEYVLAEAANGANPIVGNVLKGGAGSDTAVGIANLGIVNIAAGAYVLFHSMLPPRLLEIAIEQTFKPAAVAGLVLGQAKRLRRSAPLKSPVLAGLTGIYKRYPVSLM